MADPTGARCSTCGTVYPIRYEAILDLDVVKSDQRCVFDEQQRGRERLTTAEVEASRALAGRFLTDSGILGDGLPAGGSLLDVACGTGSTTIGLLLDGRLRGVRIYGFDHSVESLAVLHNTATATGCAQDVELSTQDIGCLAFAPDSFDAIIGNAVLHHFLDVAGTVTRLVALLRPGGRAVFAEPFLYGHLLVMALLRMAADDTPATAGAPGPLEQITENVVYRARYGTNLPALAELTDKHLFVEEDIVRLGASLNCTVRFANVEPDEYYAAFMNDVVRTWDPGAEVARRARELYRQVWSYLGDVIPRRFAHYRFMIIERS